jgi:hypothetical protein
MARPLRVQYAGAIYHILNRGDRNPVKVKLALQLRGETTMTLKWITGRLRRLLYEAQNRKKS